MSPLSRRRQPGSHAPRTIDWNAIQRDRDAMAAQVAEVENAARQGIEAFHAQKDPMLQLVARCHAIELALDVERKRVDSLYKIIEKLGGQA